MHSNLYLSIEYRDTATDRWRFLARLPDLGADPAAFTLLGEAEALADVPASERFEPRGWPEDVTDSAIDEDCFTVDDEAAESDLGEILDGVRFCSRATANEWIQRGESRPLSGGYRVTSPEIHGQSWLSMDEMQTLCVRAEHHGSGIAMQLRAFTSAMRSLADAGCGVRAVYWFGD